MLLKRFCKRLAAILAVGVLVTASPAFAAPSHLLPRQAAATPHGAAGLCARYDWACARGRGADIVTERGFGLLDRVNRKINGQVREITDLAQYRRAEHWALPTRYGGDCEDFALLKKRELIGVGVAPDRLMIATVLDRNRNSHAVLVVRTAAGDLVLDNLDDRVRHWSETGYSFLKMQDPRDPARWNAILKGGIFGI